MADSQQRYRVVEKLESGGMAEVFRAESEGLQGFKKQVAIKRVLPHLSEKKKFISMFLDEARLSAHLSHSNCVQVFDIGVGDNAYFIVMEFVDGANLKAIADTLRNKGQTFPVSEAVYIAIQICTGLASAHELRDPHGNDLFTFHRDMSPPNVLVTKHGEVKIVDFGLAKANSQLEKSEPGIIKGKFSYLSPEAAMGQDVDTRTDIFAVGIILWELLAGERLFIGDTDFQTVKKVQQAVVPSISKVNRTVPAALEQIINRALARERESRYRTARDLSRDLTNFLFAFGKPVGNFDISQLVASAMKERTKAKPKRGSIIDKLIEEALLEFTSLTEEKGGGVEGGSGPSNPDMSQSQAPLDLGAFGAPQAWRDSARGSDAGPPPRHTGPAPVSVQSGNLAALEDDAAAPAPAGGVNRTGPFAVYVPGGSGSMAAVTDRAALPPSPGLVAPVQPALPAAVATAVPSKQGSSLAMIAVIALVVVVAGGAAAWFLGVIPH